IRDRNVTGVQTWLFRSQIVNVWRIQRAQRRRQKMQLSEMLMNFGKLAGKIRIWWIDVANHGYGPQHCEDGQLFDQLPGRVGGHDLGRASCRERAELSGR